MKAGLSLILLRVVVVFRPLLGEAHQMVPFEKHTEICTRGNSVISKGGEGVEGGYCFEDGTQKSSWAKCRVSVPRRLATPLRVTLVFSNLRASIPS